MIELRPDDGLFVRPFLAVTPRDPRAFSGHVLDAIFIKFLLSAL